MQELKPGDKLKHVQGDYFINEPVDQIVGLTYVSNNTPKFSLTFGRDEVLVNQETLHEIAKGMYQAQAIPGDFEMRRVDFATFTITLETARVFRDALNQMIAGVESADHQRR